MSLSAEEKKRQKQIKNNIFNGQIQKSVKSKAQDRAELARKLAEDTEAFKASGGRVRKIPSQQVPPKKRPAMQQYGGGGFYEL